VGEAVDHRERRSKALTGGSFEAFFADQYEVLLRAMYLATGDRYEAEDLTQEAFVKAYERWDRVRAMGNPIGYVYRIAMNGHRKRVRRVVLGARRALANRPSDPISETDDRDLLRRALATLPAGQREAIVLVEWLGMSSEEAAPILGISPVAVRVRVSRAKQALRFVNERAEGAMS
jgi:RNA polymerase sigma-70 factor (ECF subfamily)